MQAENMTDRMSFFPPRFPDVGHLSDRFCYLFSIADYESVLIRLSERRCLGDWKRIYSGHMVGNLCPSSLIFAPPCHTAADRSLHSGRISSPAESNKTTTRLLHNANIVTPLLHILENSAHHELSVPVTHNETSYNDASSCHSC